MDGLNDRPPSASGLSDSREQRQDVSLTEQEQHPLSGKDSAEATEDPDQGRLATLSGAIRTILECVGEDPNREGLLKTPERYAKAMLCFTNGYKQDLLRTVNGAVFNEQYHGKVLVKDIEFFSLCEHHLVPFFGKVQVAYFPNGRVVGLSKIARIVDMFARRLQIQERLTNEIGHALFEILRPRGVAVVIEASHLCMAMRGVQKPGTSTKTSCFLGSMRGEGPLPDDSVTDLLTSGTPFIPRHVPSAQ